MTVEATRPGPTFIRVGIAHNNWYKRRGTPCGCPLRHDGLTARVKPTTNIPLKRIPKRQVKHHILKLQVVDNPAVGFGQAGLAQRDAHI